MLCEHCKKRNATTHISENVNGYVKEINLCSECASELGYNEMFGGMSINSFLGSVFPVPLQGAEVKRRCPVCKKSLDEIVSSGEAGCAECYKVFGEQLLSPLKRLHGNLRHIGKKPIRAKKEKTVAEMIAELEEEKAAAIEKQDYETAAKLRDRIAELSEGNKDE